MILQHKKTKRLYNLIGVGSNDDINCTLFLELWYRNEKKQICHAKRSFTYSSLESLKELLNGFDELAGLAIDKSNFSVYENEADKFRI